MKSDFKTFVYTLIKFAVSKFLLYNPELVLFSAVLKVSGYIIKQKSLMCSAIKEVKNGFDGAKYG